MEQITQKIDQVIYGYQPSEFMPIYQDGKLANRATFIAYKIRRTAGHIGQAVGKTIEVAGDVIETMQEA